MTTTTTIMTLMMMMTILNSKRKAIEMTMVTIAMTTT